MMLRLVTNDLHEAFDYPPPMFDADVSGDQPWDPPALPEHERLRDLASRLADLIPEPTHRFSEDPLNQAKLLGLLSDAVDALVVAASEEEFLLARAAGPAVEVGESPTWRELLVAARTHCATVVVPASSLSA